jgi:hypothetical protein
MAAIEVLDMALCWGCCEASVRTEKGVFKNLGKLGRQWRRYEKYLNKNLEQSD